MQYPAGNAVNCAGHSAAVTVASNTCTRPPSVAAQAGASNSAQRCWKAQKSEASDEAEDTPNGGVQQQPARRAKRTRAAASPVDVAGHRCHHNHRGQASRPRTTGTASGLAMLTNQDRATELCGILQV